MEKQQDLYTKEQLVKYNYLEHFMHAAEVKGPAHLWFDDEIRQKFMILSFIISGQMSIRTGVDSEVYQAKHFFILPSWSAVSEIEYSDDFHAVTIAVGNEVLIDISRNSTHLKPRLPKPENKATLMNLELTDHEMKILVDGTRNLIGALGNKDHRFIEELCYALFTVVYTDLADILWKRFSDNVEEDSVSLRSDVLFRDFISLVDRHIEKETSVEFYASELCISKQYLALIVKKKTGVSVGVLISNVRYELALKYLRKPELSVQQVAMMLSFADQSAFGKFFKKHAKVSPTEYRKDYLSSVRSKMEKD